MTSAFSFQFDGLLGASWARFAFAALLATLLSGCGRSDPIAPVEGVVMVDDLPLGNVLVTFIPMDGQYVTRSMGVTDDAGRFKLRAETQTEGAVVGEHRVTIEDMAIYDAPRAEDGTVVSMPPLRFPAIYSDPIRTPLATTVGADNANVRLSLSSQR